MPTFVALLVQLAPFVDPATLTAAWVVVLIIVLTRPPRWRWQPGRPLAQLCP